jgi:pyruvate formate lyase activating enzyme
VHRARAIARSMGLKYVYEGNIYSDGANTICPGCKRVVITRSWHSVMSNKVKNGCCSECGMRIAGVFTKAEAEKGREWAASTPVPPCETK